MPYPSKKYLWLSVALAAISLVASVFYYLLYSKIIEVSSTVGGAELQIATIEKEVRDFDAETKSLKDNDADIKLLSSAFITEDSFVDFLRVLESLASSAGVKFQAESAHLPASANEEASLDFTLEGDSAAIVKFFALLDEEPFAGIVESFSIAPKVEKSILLHASVKYFIFNFMTK